LAAWVLAALFLLALTLRLGVIGLQRAEALVGDEVLFHEIAGNLASGNGYTRGTTEDDRHPTAVRGPSYVLLVAACYRLFGPYPTVPLLLQALLDALSALLVYRLGVRWFGRPVVGLVAGVLYAVFPPFILMSASLLNETFVQFTLLLAVVLFFAYLDGRGARYLLLSAVVLGLCALSKPHAAVVGVLLGASTVPRVGWARAARATAFVVVVVGLVMAPWVARNALTFGTFVPGLTWGGLGLWLGAGPVDGRTIGSLGERGVPDSLRRYVSTLSEVETDRWGVREARRLIAARPGQYLRLSVKKVFRLWFNLGFDDTRPSRSSLLVAAFNALAILLALVGARLGRPDPSASWFLALLAAYWTLVHLPFVAVVRYVFPCLAVLFVFAAAGAVTLWSRSLPGEPLEVPVTPGRGRAAS
jgi:4-amino-4-deoxy-L-arabinose transferase-like glycosyltransferase